MGAGNGWLPQSELDKPLPASTDVLVVGGGLAGTSLAYYLAREGVEVVLVERGELNREASGTNAGSSHFQFAIRQLAGAETENVRERLRRDVNSLTAEGRMSAYVLIGLPIGLMVFLYTLNPDYIGLLFERSMGQIMLGLAVVGIVGGYAWMRKIINIEI